MKSIWGKRINLRISLPKINLPRGSYASCWTRLTRLVGRNAPQNIKARLSWQAADGASMMACCAQQKRHRHV